MISSQKPAVALRQNHTGSSKFVCGSGIPVACAWLRSCRPGPDASAWRPTPSTPRAQNQNAAAYTRSQKEVFVLTPSVRRSGRAGGCVCECPARRSRPASIPRSCSTGIAAALLSAASGCWLRVPLSEASSSTAIRTIVCHQRCEQRFARAGGGVEFQAGFVRPCPS